MNEEIVGYREDVIYGFSYLSLQGLPFVSMFVRETTRDGRRAFHLEVWG